MEWARKCWETNWQPTESTSAPVSVPALAIKKRKGNAKVVVTVASFLADSDDEDAPVEVEAPSGRDPGDVPKEDEFSKYLGLPRVGAEVDLLVWWKEHQKEFPIMAKWARQFLATPASTAGVERAFSAVGHMHGDLRKCTSESTIEHSLMAGMNTV